MLTINYWLIFEKVNY